MIDHILKFADEATAKTALPTYAPSGNWRGDCTIPGIKVITAEAVWNNSDPQNPVLVSPEVTVSGWYIAIALPTLSQELLAIPNHAVRFVSDRDRGGTAQQCIIYVAPDVEPAILAGSRVSCVFAGSNYVFGV